MDTSTPKQVYLPDKASMGAPPWVVPLSIRRVQSSEKSTAVQAQQMISLLWTPTFTEKLCVTVVDSTLSARTFLGEVKEKPNLVTIARCRSNRVFYRCPQPTDSVRGLTRWYGLSFDLKDQSTWTAPSFVQHVDLVTRRGRQLTVEIKGWQHLLMRGTREYPMHQSPFTLIRIVVTDVKGKPVFNRPMWFRVIGNRREELSPKQVWQAYHQRYDVEGFFRFGKQRLDNDHLPDA